MPNPHKTFTKKTRLLDLDSYQLGKLTDALIDEISRWRDLGQDVRFVPFADPAARDAWTRLTSVREQESIQLLRKFLEQRYETSRAVVAVVGSFSAGKSSVINALLGKDVCPVNIKPTTSAITRFVYATEPKILQRDPENSDAVPSLVTEKQYFYRVQHMPKGGRASHRKSVQLDFEYHYPWPGLANCIICDTPGFNNSQGQFDTERTRQFILAEADVLLWIIDMTMGAISGDEIKEMEQCLTEKPKLPIYLVVNKADGKGAKAQGRILDSIINNHSGTIKTAIPFSATKVSEINKLRLFEIIPDEVQLQLSHFMEAPVADKTLSTDVIVNCKRTGRNKDAYELDCEGTAVTITPQHLLFRDAKDQLIGFINDIAKNKEQTVFEGWKSDVNHYLENANKAFDELEKHVDGSNTVDNLEQTIEKHVERLMKIFDYKYVMKNIAYHFKHVFPIDKEDKSNWFNTKIEYQLSFNIDELEERLNAFFLELRFLDVAFTRVLSQFESVVKESGFTEATSLLTFYKQNVRALRNKAGKAITECAHDVFVLTSEDDNEYDDDKYEPKTYLNECEAEKQRLRFYDVLYKILDFDSKGFPRAVFEPITKWVENVKAKNVGHQQSQLNTRQNIIEKIDIARNGLFNSELNTVEHRS